MPGDRVLPKAEWDYLNAIHPDNLPGTLDALTRYGFGWVAWSTDQDGARALDAALEAGRCGSFRWDESISGPVAFLMTNVRLPDLPSWGTGTAVAVDLVTDRSQRLVARELVARGGRVGGAWAELLAEVTT